MKSVKKIALHLFYQLGFFRLWSLVRPNHISFLMLHGVMDVEEKSQWHPFRSYLSRKDLDAALSVLSRYYEFISMDEALRLLTDDRPLKKNYCVLTFDDGLKNNLTHAMPVLRRHNAPAVMYVVPGQINKQEPYWFDRLDYAIQQAVDKIDHLVVFGKEIPVTAPIKDRKYCKELFLTIKSELFYTTHTDEEATEELNRVIHELETAAGKSLLDIYADDPWSKLMGWEEIKSAADAIDITIGSHTVDHTLLGKVSESEVTSQLDESKRIIESQIQQTCLHFCYPDGSLPVTPNKFLSASNYATAVTTKPGLTYQENFNEHLINRYHMPTQDDEIFTLAWASGFLDFFKRKA